MKKFTYLIILSCIICGGYANAQTNIFPSSGPVGIGTTAPKPSAKLEIKSTTKGFLMPRMTEAQRNAIVSPVKGLEIFQTDGVSSFYFYNGAIWKLIGADVGADKSLSNLSNVAINASLSPRISGSLDLGGYQHDWNNLWLSGQIWCGGFGVLKVNYDPNHGKDNISIGGFAIQNDENTHGSIAIGIGSLFNNYGNNNIGIGWTSMSQVFYGSNNVGLGYHTNANSDSISNSTALGADAIVTASAQVRVGTTETSSIGGFVGWTTISDARFNKAIQQNIPGLEFINQLKPITYSLDVYAIKTALKNPNAKPLDKRLLSADSSFNNMQTQKPIIYTGFSGQDVEAVAKKLNFQFTAVDAPKNARDLYGLRYDEFVVPLVKAVQELSRMSYAKDSAIESLQNQINELKAMISNVSNQKEVTLSSAYVAQNTPNPFSNSTAINYFLPVGSSSAKIVITNQFGTTIKQINLSGSGNGILKINASAFASGTYKYSLYVNNVLINTKQMILTK